MVLILLLLEFELVRLLEVFIGLARLLLPVITSLAETHIVREGRQLIEVFLRALVE